MWNSVYLANECWAQKMKPEETAEDVWRPHHLVKCEGALTYIMHKETNAETLEKKLQKRTVIRSRTEDLRQYFSIMKAQWARCWVKTDKAISQARTRNMLGVEMYPSLALGPQRRSDCCYRGKRRPICHCNQPENHRREAKYAPI